jgi:hydroxyquinol 1,2-dioxygenase
MRNFNEDNITTAVLDRVNQARSPRAREIGSALIRHLHDFVREIQPTQQEWEFAIEFLTRTGQMCSSTRQEFILLSDTLGVSMLVDAINHRFPGSATETTILGPFYVQHGPEFELGATICRPEEGPLLLIEGVVQGIDGEVIAGATVDVWNADHDGFYDVQKDDARPSGRGSFRTNAGGRFWLYTVVPAAYPIPDDGPVGKMLNAQGRHPYRPAHIHFMISATGYETLITHIFLSTSEYLDSDVVFGVKDSLIQNLEIIPAGVTAYGAVVKESTSVLRRNFVLPLVGAKDSRYDMTAERPSEDSI